jgi:Lar family restriction alleviation protein
MSDPELLPCPFCGDSATLSGLGGYHEVECTNCNVITRYSRSRAEVIDAWNQRTPASAVLPERHSRDTP